MMSKLIYSISLSKVSSFTSSCRVDLQYFLFLYTLRNVNSKIVFLDKNIINNMEAVSGRYPPNIVFQNHDIPISKLPFLDSQYFP